MYRVDLHTHSVASHDGGISEENYISVLSTDKLDFVAVTDHNLIDFALNLRKKLGDKIIVGEEIMTTHGEIIGLFLKKLVKPGMSPIQTIEAIRSQNGLVYIPHPFETIRHGLNESVMNEVSDSIDIVEVVNGRAWLQDKSKKAQFWAKLNHKSTAVSSDAHGMGALGKTCSVLKSTPTNSNLVEELLKSTAITSGPSMRDLLYPKLNKLIKKVGRG